MANSVTPDGDYRPNLPALKRMYDESQTLTHDGRVSSQKDGDYYDGVQLTRDEKRILNKRKQPANPWNFTRLAVNGTLGVIKQGATDPRAYPRNPQDEDSADVASKVLRYIADKSKFDALKIDFAKDYLVPGTGAVIIEVDDDRNVSLQPIRWEEFFYDPRSRRQDFSDARYMGIAKWQWADDVKAEYPAKKDEIERCFADGGFADELTDDRPSDGAKSVAWVDKRQQRIMVVEMYYREGNVWRRCKFTSGVDLESGVSAYVNDKKQPICPIEAQSCYVDRENNRMGVVRDMRAIQDEINKRASKLLFELTARQVQEAAPGQGMGDVDEVRKQAQLPDGVIPSGWQIVPRQDIVAGQSELLQLAIATMQRFSPNPAILGREGEDQSGRANQVRQQAGMTEMAVIFGGIEEWEQRVYVQMWMRAQQFMTAPDYVRITDDEGSPEFVGINQPPEGGQLTPDMTQDPDEQGAYPPMMQEGKPVFAMPDGSHVLGYENSLAELDVDIMIDTVPDVANLQAEQFAMLTELAKIYGPQEVPFDDLLECSTMPNKRKTLEKRKARSEEQAGQAQENPAAQLQLRGAMAEVAKLESETDLNRAKTQTELAKPEIEAAKLQQSALDGADQRQHEAMEADAERAHAAVNADADRQHTASLQREGMAQKDRQFEAGLNSQERLARMKPPPGK